MVSKEQVLEVLRDVEDPEVHKSIVELDMVKNLVIQDSHISVEVLLTISGCPLRNTIEQAVTEKLLSLEGVKTVDVKIGSMNDEQRAQFTQKLRGKPEERSTPALLKPDTDVVFLAIASGKGGVGKSTVTANLARAMAKQGLRVGIIDADIYGFSIPSIFGVRERKPTVIDDLIMPIEVDGVKLISMHFFVPENNPVVWRGPMLGKMLRNFFGEVHWGDLDVVLLDLPPGTGDVALDVHQLLPKSKELIVTTPQMNAAEVAIRAGLMGLRTNHEVVGVVENMAYFECGNCGDKTYLFGRGGGEEVARGLRTSVLAQVPIAALETTALFKDGTRQAEVFADLAKEVSKRIGLLGKVAAK
ncbi:Mrp/NBP35 family ATP-binding protein [Alicyclobacillus tolerans]|uniref:Mrp/NBP35 family ATP-binding protein n=1 Tax=Alicyclobacillus tolerans TaxID=90970 RepID=UPI001F48C908|nr:Mrp/NBP35 family ATP-binding protein [Alicyclobacillus tolerans]MCF8565974.1 Mrp/NBP35 family ATP-binding protein [Alicyclobacillus tolerans]